MSLRIRLRPALLVLPWLLLLSAHAHAASSSDGDLRFGARLYGQLRGRPGDLFFSPTSLRMGLAMAAAGARGRTAAELQAGLALPGGAAAHEQMSAQLRHWEQLSPANDRGFALRVANRLWAQRGRALQAGFLAVTRDAYRAPLASLDFAGDAEASRGAINRWVDERTEHLIPSLLAPGSISGATRLVLTNAVYFKAGWLRPFDRERTRDGVFTGARGRVRVPLMHQTDGFRYAAIDGGQLLELPYAAGDLVMDVMLPARADGLAALEQQLVAGALPRWLDRMFQARVEVTLPRFHTASTIDAATALAALGMPSAFDPARADFSGIDGARDLYIGGVLHQAVVQVEERGTEAAAATAIVVEATAALVEPSPPIVFRADHPFLYLIRDARSGAVLFMGRLAAPART
jgi:serpin B